MTTSESAPSSPSSSSDHHRTNQVANVIKNWEFLEDGFMDLIFSSSGRTDLEHLEKEDVKLLWEFTTEEAMDDWPREDTARLIHLLLDIDNTRQGLSYGHIEHFLLESASSDDTEWCLGLLSRMLETVDNHHLNETLHENEHGNTLLHVAASCDHRSSQIFHLLHDHNHQWISHQNHNLSLPLHCIFHALIDFDDNDIDCVSTLLGFNPHAVHIKNKDGCLPFHVVCKFCGLGSYPIARLIYEANPLAVKTRLLSEQFQYEYPLHFLLRDAFYRDETVIFFVLEVFPQCLMLENGLGFTPFQVIDDHYAAEGGMGGLFNHMRQSIYLKQMVSEMKDPQNGNNIFHVMSKRTFTSEAARFFQLETTVVMFLELLSMFPRLIFQENNQGDLPIHVLLNNDGDRCDFEEVEALMKVYDDHCIKEGRTNIVDCPPNLNGEDKEYPLLLAASQNNPCISIIYYFAKRLVTLQGGFHC